MKISIIIPAYNEEVYIGKCLESIIANQRPEFSEIIVVDNGSTDRTRAVVQRFPAVTLAEEPAKGVTKARQRGLMMARGDLVAFLDADTVMPREWGAMVVREFTDHPEIVSLSGPFRYNDLPALHKVFAESLWKVFAPPIYRMIGFMVLGANFVARREALMKIGGFDTTIAFYGDDTDIARRLSKVGQVKFSMDFFIVGSGRRLMAQGLMKTFWIYAINYLWGAAHQGPRTKEYNDFR